MHQALDYVLNNAEQNNPESILKIIDEYVLKSGKFLMNVGPEKGKLLTKSLLDTRPKKVLELGTFLGYSAVLIASNIENESTLTTIDSDKNSIEIASKMLDFAGLINKVNLVHGAADKILPSLNSKFQFVFIDHAKKKYLPDLELIEKNRLIESQSIVFADNVGIFEDDMKNYFSHVRNSGKYTSQNIGSTLEYRNNIYDAVEISVMN